jgi:arylsulfatase A-like enzyme
VREPLLVCRPGTIAGGRTLDDVVTLCDLYPTFLSTAGLPLRPDQHVDGVDLLPLLQEGTPLQREAIYFHHPHYTPQGDSPHSAIRADDWKLIEHFDHGRVELFNLRDDPGEHYDLSAQAPDLHRDLHERLIAWRQETGALIPEREVG